MINEMITAKLAMLTGVSKAILPPLAVVCMLASDVIDAPTGLSLTIVASVIGALWYLQGRLTKIETKLEILHDEVKALPCHGNDRCNHKGT